MSGTATLTDTGTAPHTLGVFLRDRREKLDPPSLGLPPGRRRTPGLRREEVAHRANISAAWYICLEQGRGGAPSADVLESLAKALLLTDAEREHLFLIGLGRPPEIAYRCPDHTEPRLQRILDGLSPAPALIKTATWDVVAWNAAAAVLWPGLSELPPEQRNTLRMLFLDPQSRVLYRDWLGVARMAVASFRADVTRAGAVDRVAAFVDNLAQASPAFKAMWGDKDVSENHHAVKEFQHPTLGPLRFEGSTFGVDGRQDLAMLVFMPADADVARRVESELRVQ